MGIRMDADDREEIWQDFHGLHVPEAVTKLNQLLDDVLPVVRSMVIITGRGIHSTSGNPKLRKALEDQLSRRAPNVVVQPVDCNPGALRIHYAAP
eukprot:6566483-Prymnesium_polylepis.1